MRFSKRQSLAKLRALLFVIFNESSTSIRLHYIPFLKAASEDT